MKKDFVIILNDLPIECNKEFISTNFKSLFGSPQQSAPFGFLLNNQEEDKKKVTLQIEGGNDFYDVTKKIFQGENYEVTENNFNYLTKLSSQIKSDNLQTKLNSFCYQRECDENQIDQHPSIQFLVEISTLIHKLNLTNYEDISSQIKQKICLPVVEKENFASINNLDDNEDNSNSDPSDSEKNKEKKSLSIEKIGDKELIKLLYYEMINILSIGFNSFEIFNNHQQKIDLILQLIRLIDQEFLINFGPDFRNILINGLIKFTIDKYGKVKKQKSSLTNNRQEIHYLIYYLLSNHLIQLSQIHQEGENIDFYFLEFFKEEEIQYFFKDNQQIVDLLEKEIDKSKSKSKNRNKKEKSKEENLVQFISKSVNEGLNQDNEIIKILINDDIEKFNELFDEDATVNSFQLPALIQNLSCLSALNNNCSLLELSAFFGSKNIFEYLKTNQQEVDKSTNLLSYVINGQHPQIIKQFLSMIDMANKSLILRILSFCVDHHFNETFDMIYSSVMEDGLELTFEELDKFMKKCVSRGYFDMIPSLLKEGASSTVLLNLFCKYNNEVGIEYMLEFHNIDINEPYNNIKPLEYCINNKNTSGAILLLKNDFINIQSIDELKDEKLIHFACRLGLSKVVSYLLSNHLYSANEPTKEGVCPIHLACESGNYETVLAVIRSKKVNIRIKVKTGEFAKRTALHFACCSGNARILSLLLDSDDRFDCNEEDCQKKSPAIYAIEGDYIDCVRILLEQEEFNIDQEFGNDNLLQYACINSKIEVFDLLLDAISFDPNQPCSNGNTILVVAIMNNDTHIVNSILKKYGNSVNVNIDTKDGQTPLIIACDLGEVDIVKLLLDQDFIKINKCASSDGKTAFMAAAKSGNVELLELLKNTEDIDIYAKNKTGLSAIHFAFFAEQIEAIKFLLPLFSDKLNDTTSNGETLLQIACKKGNIELSKVLINHPDVEVNTRDNEGMTPFLSSVQEGSFDLIKALIESKKCNINEKTKKGDNAFLIAVENQNLELVKFFIDVYTSNYKPRKRKSKNNQNNDFVDINAKNKEDQNALFIALKLKNKEILKELIESPSIDINEVSNDRTFLCKLVKTISKSQKDIYFDLLDLVLNRPDIEVNEASAKYNNQTCLHVACKSPVHKIKLINRLINVENIDVNAKSKEGSPLFLLIGHQSVFFNVKTEMDYNAKQESNNAFTNNAFTNNAFTNNYHEDDNDENDYDENEKEDGDSVESEDDDEPKKEYWFEFLEHPNLDCNEGGNPTYLDDSDIDKNDQNNRYIGRFRKRFNRNQNKKKKEKKVIKNEYESPLELALGRKYFNIAEQLLNHEEINVNSNSNSKKRTPLHLAILSKNINIINQILSKDNVDVNIQDVNGKTPLLLAIDQKNRILVKVILDLLKREDVIEGINLQSTPELMTPFLSSILNPYTLIFSSLLQIDQVDLEARDNNERAAVFLLIDEIYGSFKKKIDDIDNYTFYNINQEIEIKQVPEIEDSLERIKMIYSKYPDDEITKFVSTLNHPTKSGQTVLFQAIYNLKSANDLIYKKKDENKNNYFNDNIEKKRSSKKASEYTNYQNIMTNIISFLLQQENIDLSLPENIISPDELLKTAPVLNTSLLHLACSVPIPSIIEQLIPLTISFYEEKGIEENIFTQENVKGDTILNIACNSNSIGSISAIINYVMDEENQINYNDSNEFDINKESSDGLAPIHKICQIKETEESLILLNKILSFENLDVCSISSSKLKTAVHYACENKNKSIVNILVDNLSDVINPNVYDNDGLTPLLSSTIEKECEIIKSLLKLESIDLNLALPLTNKTAFFVACENWDTAAVSIFLNDSRTDINCQIAETAKTPLMYNIEMNKNDLFEIILNDNRIDLNIIDSEGLTALHYACRKGIVQHINKIISKQIELKGDNNIESFLNAQTKSGLTPLHYVCMSNNNEAILFYMRLNGVDISIKDNNNQSAFDIYILNHSGPISEAVFEAFSSQDAKHFETNASLQELCERNHFNAVKFIISNIMFDVNNNDYKDKMTLLHVLCRYQKEEIVQKLIQVDGIDINQVDENQMTPLHYAIKYCHKKEIIQMLLDTNECDINAVDKKGCNALHYAIEYNKYFVFSDLLNYKGKFNEHIDVNQQDNNGSSILHKMAKSRSFNPYILDLLFNHQSLDPINVNAIDKNGNTPIHVACINENSQFIKQLIDLDYNNNIDINIINKKYQTPLFITCLKGSFLIFDILFSSKLSDKIDINLTSPIYIAAYKKNFMLVKKLIDMDGIDLNSNKINEGNSSETSDIESYVDENNNYVSNEDFHYDFSGMNLLHIMCCYKSTELLKKIIEFDVFDINEETADYVEQKHNGTALIVSLKNNQISNFYLLIEHYKSKLDLSFYDSNGMAAIHYSLNSSINILKELINIDDSIINMKTQNKCEETPLMIAIRIDKIDSAILLLQQPSINVLCQSSTNNSTIVHFAASKKRQDIINLVLNKIKSSSNDKEVIDLINATNDNGDTALLIACMNENLYVVKTLIDTFRNSLDFSIASNNRITPFSAALNTTNDELIHLLLSNDNCMSSVDLSVPISSGNNYAIHLVTQNSNLENFKLLLSQVPDHSSDLNVDLFSVKNDDGQTVIDIAINNRKDDIFSYICDTQNPDLNIMVKNTPPSEAYMIKKRYRRPHNYEINTLTAVSNIPLVFYAVKYYDCRIFESIILHGSFDLNRKFDGKTLLHYACETNIDPNEKVVFLVKQPGIDVNCVNTKGGGTPLHIAVKKRKIDVIETLLGLGDRIDYNKENSNGVSPYMAAPYRIRKIFDGMLQNVKKPKGYY